MAICLNGKYEIENRQDAVAEFDEGALLVFAGPGTGKTDSLLRRIEKLLADGVAPKHICYLTFVNSIVNAFRKDFEKPVCDRGLGQDPDVLGIKLTTLHSLAFKIIKIYGEKQNISEYVEMIDLDVRRRRTLGALFRKDFRDWSIQSGLVSDAEQFDAAQSSIIRMWRTGDKLPSAIDPIYKALISGCEKYQVRIWDELVPLAIRAIEDNGLPTWLGNIRHYAIDEYQDFNPAEQRLIDIIISGADSTVIVGDADQSIYSMRGASPYGVEKLMAQADAYYVNFTLCRRCPCKVIEGANNLLKYMAADSYADRLLEPHSDRNGVLYVGELNSGMEEIANLAKWTKKWLGTDDTEVLFLFPSNEIKDWYYSQLVEVGVPCRAKMEEDDNVRLGVLLKFALLKTHPILERYLIGQYPALNKFFMNSALSLMMENGVPPRESLMQLRANGQMPKKALEQHDLLEHQIAALISDDMEQVTKILKEYGIEIEPDELSCLFAFDQSIPANDRVSQFLSVRTAWQQEAEGKKRYAEFLTMHGAKGLSTDIVIIPGFSNMLIPGAKEGELLAEQHRLIYVAITRAKKAVIITYPTKRGRKDKLYYTSKGTDARISQYARIISPGNTQRT